MRPFRTEAWQVDILLASCVAQLHHTREQKCFWCAYISQVYEDRRQESLKIMEETKHKRDKIQEVITYIEVQ